MAACEALASSRITLIGIALIWMTAQVLVVVAHDFRIRAGTHRNISREWPGELHPRARVTSAGFAGNAKLVSHSHQINQRCRSHLAGYLAAVDLYQLAAEIRGTEANEVWCIFDNSASGAATANALAMQTQVVTIG
jgi:hypothetical protein